MLDRELSSVEWTRMFGKPRCTHIESYAYDHSLLVLDIMPRRKRKRIRFFFFYKSWAQREGINEVIKKAWEKHCEGSRMFKVVKKIRQIKVELLKWRNNSGDNSRKRINQIKEQLKNV